MNYSTANEPAEATPVLHDIDTRPAAGIGDKVVVPACDVGEIVAIDTLTIDGRQSDFYRIRFPRGAKTWIPLGRMIEKGVRSVMSVANAEEALDVVAAQEAPEKRANWNRRQRRYNEMLLDNKPRGLAELLGELAAVRRKKGTLSFGEKKLFEQVRALMISEISLALRIDPTLAESRLEAAMAG